MRNSSSRLRVVNCLLRRHQRGKRSLSRISYEISHILLLTSLNVNQDIRDGNPSKLIPRAATVTSDHLCHTLLRFEIRRR